MASAIARLLFAALCGAGALDLGRLQLPANQFEPMHPHVQESLRQVLGLSAMRVSLIPDNRGSNGGIWIVTDLQGRAPDLVIKSRPPAPTLVPELLPEPQHYMKLAREVPSLARDPSLVFPTMILACYGPSGAKVTDLIVMRRAPGTILGTYIAEMSVAGELGRRNLNAMLEKVGRHLRAFHDAYGMQHTDFQTSNIMVDKADATITFLDLGGMGQPAAESDHVHLRETLRMLAPMYAPGLLMGSYSHFESGYRSGVSIAPVPLAPSTAPTPDASGDGSDRCGLTEGVAEVEEDAPRFCLRGSCPRRLLPTAKFPAASLPKIETMQPKETEELPGGNLAKIEAMQTKETEAKDPWSLSKLVDNADQLLSWKVAGAMWLAPVAFARRGA